MSPGLCLIGRPKMHTRWEVSFKSRTSLSHPVSPITLSHHLHGLPPPPALSSWPLVLVPSPGFSDTDPSLCYICPIQDCNVFHVLYTPPPFPMDFDQTQPIPTDSARQSVGIPTESIRLDQIPLLVQSKSSESPVKSLWNRKSLDWPVRWTSTRLLLDFQ